jgi:hypothetical protein
MLQIRRPRITIALDASGVVGIDAIWRFRGWRLNSFARAPLGPGALVPSAVDSNFVRPNDVLAALSSLRRRLGASGRKALFMLPDGVARLARLESPRRSFAEKHRIRLAQNLPYPSSEAVIDALYLGDDVFVAGAVRRGIVQEYERLIIEAGWAPERIDLAPLAALSRLRHKPPHEGAGIDVILGDVALSIAAWSAGALKFLRNRRRAHGSNEMERLWAEVDRTIALLGEAADHRVRVVGTDALEFLAYASSIGRSATPAWELRHRSFDMEGAELSWLGAALA